MEFPGAFSYTLEEVLHFIFEQIKRPAEGSKFYTRYPQACVGYGYEAWCPWLVVYIQFGRLWCIRAFPWIQNWLCEKFKGANITYCHAWTVNQWWFIKVPYSIFLRAQFE